MIDPVLLLPQRDEGGPLIESVMDDQPLVYRTGLIDHNAAMVRPSVPDARWF